jgi:hypothetical protein
MSMSGHAVRFSSSWRMAGVTGVQDMEAEDTRALDQIGSSPAAEAGGPTECLVRRLIPSYWGYPAPTMNREFRPLSAWNTRVNQSNESRRSKSWKLTGGTVAFSGLFGPSGLQPGESHMGLTTVVQRRSKMEP